VHQVVHRAHDALAVARVVVAPFTDSLQAVGSAVANESVEITATVTDRVTAISCEEGELARAGQVLVQLDTAEEEAELAEAVANLDDQRRQLSRLDALVATNSASRAQRDELRARVEAAQARVQGVRARIADRTIVAPFTGLVGLREVSQGALVTAGGRITTLDEIEPLRLDFSIPENFLSSLHPGAVVRARTVAYPDRDFRGLVAHISPRVDPLTRSVAVRAELPNEARLLRPGMLLGVDLGREQRLAASHHLDRVDERVAVGALEEKAGGAGTQRLVDVLIVVEGRQDDHACRR
jgi:membrane fusion protein (multidrug efflux system)